MICPVCRLSNRQRLIASLVIERLADNPDAHIYCMEQLTPLWRWLNGVARTSTGSEFISHQLNSGDRVGVTGYLASLALSVNPAMVLRNLKTALRVFVQGGIGHEDATALSFADESFDLVISNDVFEHVHDPVAAFSECLRCLRPGGQLLVTFPFNSRMESSLTRARLVDGQVEYLAEPVFHGNPLNDEGALVFTDFGWDVFDSILAAGFRDVIPELYRSANHGHRGPGLVVFRATR